MTLRLEKRLCFGIRPVGAEKMQAGPDDWTIVDGDDPLALGLTLLELHTDDAPRSWEVRRFMRTVLLDPGEDNGRDEDGEKLLRLHPMSAPKEGV